MPAEAAAIFTRPQKTARTERDQATSGQFQPEGLFRFALEARGLANRVGHRRVKHDHPRQRTPAVGRLEQVGLHRPTWLDLVANQSPNDARGPVLAEHLEPGCTGPLNLVLVKIERAEEIEPPQAEFLPPPLPLGKGLDRAAILIRQQRRKGPAPPRHLPGRLLNFVQPRDLLWQFFSPPRVNT